MQEDMSVDLNFILWGGDARKKRRSLDGEYRIDIVVSTSLRVACLKANNVLLLLLLFLKDNNLVCFVC